MKKHYLGQLQIEANVPNSDILNEFINVTVDFAIICPQCGPERQKLKKNGHDTKLQGKPQVFHCKRCKKSFFAHTSWVFKEFTNLILEQVMDCLFVKKLSPKSVADKFKVSQSLISRIQYSCSQLLEKKIEYYRSELKTLSEYENIPVDLLSAIWWDETYFKINGVYYCLIVIINAFGKVLGYKFGKSRKDYDYMSILDPIKDSLPEIPIFICDGNSTYESVVKQLNKEAYLIQHIHSHPWNEVKLHHFLPLESEKKFEQYTLSIPYDAFKRKKRVNGYALKRISTVKPSTHFKGQRGRPKGSKDRKQRAKYGSKSEKKTQSKPKKRGRPNLKESGHKISFLPKRRNNSWKIKILSRGSKRKEANFPETRRISKILTTTYNVMGGSYIQSNLIESKNAIIKRLIKKIGLKNVYQFDYLLGTHLYANGDIIKLPWESNGLNVNFSSNLGFTNMLSMFIPNKEQIKVI